MDFDHDEDVDMGDHQEQAGNEDQEIMDYDDIPVNQEDAWAVIRYVAFVKMANKRQANEVCMWRALKRKRKLGGLLGSSFLWYLTYSALCVL